MASERRADRKAQNASRREQNKRARAQKKAAGKASAGGRKPRPRVAQKITTAKNVNPGVTQTSPGVRKTSPGRDTGNHPHMKVAPQIPTARNVTPRVTPPRITTAKNVNPGLKALTPKGAPSATIKTAPTKPTTLSKPSTTLGRKARPPVVEESKYKPVAKPAAVTAPKLKAVPSAPRMSSQSSYSSTSKPTSKPTSTTSKDSSSTRTQPQLKAQLKMGSKLSAYASGSSGTPKKTGARLTRRGRR